MSVSTTEKYTIGVIKTIFHRAYNISSDWQTLHREIGRYYTGRLADITQRDWQTLHRKIGRHYTGILADITQGDWQTLHRALADITQGDWQTLHRQIAHIKQLLINNIILFALLRSQLINSYDRTITSMNSCNRTIPPMNRNRMPMKFVFYKNQMTSNFKQEEKQLKYIIYG